MPKPKTYDHVIRLGAMSPADILNEISAIQANTEKAEGVKLKVARTITGQHEGDDIVRVIFEEVPGAAVVPYTPPPAAPAGPIDNLQAKRDREALINRAFTPEQQKALGMILERWWSQKMAGIETQLVAEAVVEHPRRIAALEAEVAELKSRFGAGRNLKDSGA